MTQIKAEDWAKKDVHLVRLIGYSAIGFILVTFILWGTIARLNGAVIAQGALEVASHRQIVQHQIGGKVKELLVNNGDEVKFGEVILELDDQLIRPEYEIYDRLYIEALAEKGRLIAERDELDAPRFPDTLIELAQTRQDAQEAIDAQNGLFTFRKDAVIRELELIKDRTAQIEKQITGNQAELKATQDQEKYLADELYNQQKLLNRKLADRTQVTSIRNQYAGIQGRVGQLEANIAALNEEFSSMETEKLKLIAKPREEAIARLRELESQEVEYFQRRSTLGRQLEELDIRAPISGTVYGMQIFTSDTVVEAAQPLMYIVPSGDDLIVRARIEAADINDVYIGQEGELRFTAYNQRQIPFISGELINVSADAYVDDKTGVRFYQIEIEPEDSIGEKLKDEVLIPGQTVEIFLHTEARSFLDYLIKPLIDNFKRAFREE